ncbi:MAG TPA: catalase family protein [Nannocystis sp.]|jgi:hypothetical protein
MMQPRTDWAETIPPGEDAALLRLAEILAALQARRARKGRLGRALHFKGHGGVRAEVRTRDGLPAPYAVGIFAGAATYPAYVRFSNATGKPQPDRLGDVRGFALKIVGVPGKKLIPGMEDATTQDFLLIRTPVTPFRSAEEFVRMIQVVDNPLMLFAAMARLGVGRVLTIARQAAASMKSPTTTLATPRFYSALPIRWGEHAGRVSLTPVPPLDERTHGDGGPDALRGDLAARLKAGPIAFTLAVQLYVDPQRTPIEDGSVDWSEDDSPYVPVADVVLPQQDLTDDRGRELDAYVEQLSFDPWHAPVEFRPLGNLMRARNHAYRLSTTARKAGPEPDGSETFL